MKNGLISSLHLFCLCCLGLFLSFSPSLTAQEQHLQALDIVIDTPTGFVTSTRFTGFEQVESFATIKFAETGQSLAAVTSQWLNTHPAPLSSEDVTISGRSGLLLNNTKNINGNQFQQWTLLLGDKISSISIVASYPVALAGSMENLLKTALLSTRWLRQASKQIFQGLPFTVNQSKQLHFLKRTANSLILQDKTPYDRSKSIAPVMVISHAKSEQVITDIVAFARQQLNQSDMLEQIKITSEQEFKIAGIRSYRIIARARHKKTGLPVIFYQAIAFQQQRFLLLMGLAGETQQQQFLPQFEQVTASVSFKKVG